MICQRYLQYFVQYAQTTFSADLLKHIKTNSDPKVKNIPIILLSNLGQESDIEKGQKLGANDYLIKAEFTTDEIVEKIKSTLSKIKK